MVVCENQWRAFSELVVLVVDFLMLKPTISTSKNVMHAFPIFLFAVASLLGGVSEAFMHAFLFSRDELRSLRGACCNA